MTAFLIAALLLAAGTLLLVLRPLLLRAGTAAAPSQRQVNVAAYPTEEPAEPEIGAAWFNSATNCLYIWDGVEWICVPLD